MCPDRPPIPDPIKREVRQRCGFGCVICGHPIYDYDHLLGWAETQRHVAEEITLLCAADHDKKTRGLITSARVVAANSSPWNVAEGISSPFGIDFDASHEIEMMLGSNSFVSDGSLAPIVIDDFSPVFFGRDDEGVKLHLELLDRWNLPILRVDANELAYSVARNWDVQFVGQTLTIRNGPGEIMLRIRFVVPNRIEIDRAELYRNGVHISIMSGQVIVNGANAVSLSGNRYMNSPIAFTIGHCPSFPRPPMPLMAMQCERYSPPVQLDQDVNAATD